MNKLVTGQKIQVWYQGKEFTGWVNATIRFVYVDKIIVNYDDQIPNPASSEEITRDDDIASKIRLNIEISQFKQDQIVQYKLKQHWVDAEVKYVGDKFIRITYDGGNGNIETHQIQEYEYYDKIRIIPQIKLDQASQCKDRANDDDNQCTEAVQEKMDIDADGANIPGGGDNDVQLDAGDEAAADTPGNLDPTITDMDGKKAADGTAVNNDNAAVNKRWYHKIPGATTVGNGIKSGYNYMTKPAKKKRNWDQKAIHQWNHEDVMSWINSLQSSDKYSPDKFSKSAGFDGNELLQADESVLASYITNPMYRKIFIKHIEKARKTYKIAKKLKNEDEYEQDDEKAIPNNAANESINGIVGLVNQGNTCYMNTSIQILSQSPYITRYLAKRAKLKNYSNYPMLNAWITLCDFIYNQACTPGYYDVFKPKQIREALTKKDKEFGSGRQDDAARALVYMLQELDKEIDKEANASSKASKDCVVIKSKSALSPTNIDKYVTRLLDEHNPDQISSVLKKTFHGIELISAECLDCNEIYNNFAVFSVMTLQVMSQRLTLQNIHVVHNNKYYSTIPEFSALSNCSVNVLKYHAINYLREEYELSTKINKDRIDIISVSEDGSMNNISRDRIADLQNADATVFVLINNKQASKKKKHYMLQLCLGVNKDGATSHVLKTEAGACISYNIYDQSSISKLVQQKVAAYNKSLDDEKCDYYINYNDNIFSMDELQQYGVGKSMHNDGINKLLVLRVNPITDLCGYDIQNLNQKLLGEAEYENGSCSTLQALNKYKKKKNQIKKEHQTKGRYQHIKEEVDSEISAIDQAIAVIKAKQNIKGITSKFLQNKNKIKASLHGQLESLIDCIKEYEEPRILDESVYAHSCPCKLGSGKENSQWVKYQKKIVYSPPILLFHLDRYGDISESAPTRTVKQRKRYKAGQSILAKWTNNKWYDATIIDIKSSGMNIKFYDGVPMWVGKAEYSSKISRLSASSSTISNTNNKYSHDINYNMKLEYDQRYNLYGVSNHSGSTQGGHYIATVNCLSDQEWYDVTDEVLTSVDYQSATLHSQDATILAYFRDTE